MNFLLIALVSLKALASTGPQSVVEEIFAKAGSAEIATSEVKQAEVNAQVDFDSLAKAALGSTAKTVKPAEFNWFRDTLKEIITRTVYPKAPEFLSGVKITYDATEEKAGKATVKSNVQNKADLTDVNYVMKKAADGSWKVVDVSISGLSWVDSINDQVREVVKKKKWQGLKDAMNKKLAELKSGKSA